MKKILSVLALVVFLAGIAAPAFASMNSTVVTVKIADDDPKKDAKKKSSDCATEKKSSDCTTEKKSSDCKSEKKSSDCSTEKKSSDCGK